MQRQTPRDRVHRYDAQGVAGLVDRPASPRAGLLNAEHLAEFDRMVEAGPDVSVDGAVRWRRVGLKGVIDRRSGVVMGERTRGVCRKRGTFSTCRCGRPTHAAMRR